METVVAAEDSQTLEESKTLKNTMRANGKTRAQVARQLPIKSRPLSPQGQRPLLPQDKQVGITFRLPNLITYYP